VPPISQAPKASWGTTVSLQTMKVEQVPAEFEETSNPWQYTEPFSFGQKPNSSVKQAK